MPATEVPGGIPEMSPLSLYLRRPTGTDPVNFNDPTGRNAAIPGLCPAEFEFCGEWRWLDGGGGGGGGAGWDPCWGSYFDPMPNPACYVPVALPFLLGNDDDGPSLCDAADGLTADQTAAVETVMGENSWYLIGHKSYRPGDTAGNPSGPTITRSTVYTEDVDMFSVLVNRTQTAGFPSTIGAVATQPGQFTGYSAGRTKFNAALASTETSTLCNDLRDFVGAMNNVLTNGSQLAKKYIYWKASDQGGGRLHGYRRGDIYVANTAFGIVN